MWLRCRLVAIPSGVRSRWPMASVRSAVSGGGPCSGLVRAASSTAWALPTRDEPVRAGRGQVVLGQVSGVGQYDPDHVPGGIGGRGGGSGGGPGGSVVGDHRGGLYRGGGHRGIGDHGGRIVVRTHRDDQPVGAGHGLAVVALQPPSTPQRHHRGVAVAASGFAVRATAAASCASQRSARRLLGPRQRVGAEDERH